MAERFRVLVIDDDPGIRDYLETLASRQGYDVTAAGDGEEALATLDQSRPDIITLDAVLPGMDGLEILRHLKQRMPETPVIMLSGHGQARTIVEAMKLGASDFLRKPFEAEELELAFQKALENHALKEEVEHLRGRVRNERSILGLFGDNPKMREVREIIEQVADTDITVLIRGESGTGKELVARGLYSLSGRRDRPFVKVNCAALPSELLESELFGFEKGAFTGAQKRKLGKFEYANNGTIFLDEISLLGPDLQGKLLRVLQERSFTRVGGNRNIEVDVRVICATHKDLPQLAREGDFREDLYYRISEIAIRIPALREREGDALLLARVFLEKYSQQMGKQQHRFSKDALAAIEAYPWPGNVRELENRVKRSVIMAEHKQISASDLELGGAGTDDTRTFNLREIREQAERQAIVRAMSHVGGKISQASELLGVSRPTMYDLIKKYNLK